MSSNNPFRRKPESQLPGSYGGSAANVPRPPALSTERRTSKVKHVRIQTPPPLSPDSVHEDEDATINRIGNETHEGSPPPDPNRIAPSVVEAFSEQHDSFGRSDSEDEEQTNQELLNNTRNNSASSTAAVVNVPIIRNPFQKTLATMEPTNRARPSSTLDMAQNEPKSSLTGRDALDVDSFKRLLLTGTKDAGPAEPSPAPSSSGTATTNSSYFTGDSNSTDASSISRRSVDETASAGPDLGYETASSDEDKELAPRSQQLSNKPEKPAPPKHRHGKSIDHMRIPQIVDFSAFAPTSETTIAPSRGISKPVPPIPPQRTSKTDALPQYQSIAGSQSLQTAEPLPMPSLEPALRRTTSPSPSREVVSAPPPPLARRTSQKTPQQDLGPPSNAVSPLRSPSLSTSIPSLVKSSRPPPPPPSRRSNKTAHSGETFPAANPPAVHDTSRSSSVSSFHRAAMAPPPPPRRRGSSRSSLDQMPIGTAGSPSFARGSVDDRRSSVVSLQRVAEGGEGTEGKGGAVLADMDALQAEIDALKAKYGTNG